MLCAELNVGMLRTATALWPAAPQRSLLLPAWGRSVELLPSEAMALGVFAPLLRIRLRPSASGGSVTVTWRHADEALPRCVRVALYARSLGCPLCGHRRKRLYLHRALCGCRRCVRRLLRTTGAVPRYARPVAAAPYGHGRAV